MVTAEDLEMSAPHEAKRPMVIALLFASHALRLTAVSLLLTQIAAWSGVSSTLTSIAEQHRLLPAFLLCVTFAAGVDLSRGRFAGPMEGAAAFGWISMVVGCIVASLFCGVGCLVVEPPC